MPHTDTSCSPTTVSPQTKITSLRSLRPTPTIGLRPTGMKWPVWHHGARKTTCIERGTSPATVQLELVRESNVPLWGGGGGLVWQTRSSATSAAGGHQEPSSVTVLEGQPHRLDHRCPQASNKTCSLLPSGWRYWRVKYSTSGFKDSFSPAAVRLLNRFRSMSTSCNNPDCLLIAYTTNLQMPLVRYSHSCISAVVSFACNFQCLLTVNLHMELVLHYSWHFCRLL